MSLALYPLSAFRAMNQAALNVYRAIRAEGTQKNVRRHACRPAPSCTTSSTTTRTSRSSINCSPRKNIDERRTADARRPKPKKSVALSGVPAGNTALCTVGRHGNDLHYRGYDILDFAEQAEFEEVAYLLVHGKLPTAAELAPTSRSCKALRGLPAAVQDILEAVPANTPSDGRAAHRLLGARLGAAGESRSTKWPRRATSPTG